MKKINLTRGRFATVDDEDFEYLNQWKWYCSNEGYARRSMRSGDYYKDLRMHRVINKTPLGMDTDHKNGDRLDNRKGNLRSCTRSENNVNGVMRRNNTSGFKGVSWSKENKKWIVRPRIKGKGVYVGLFDNKKDAASAYKKFIKSQYGDFVVSGNFESKDNALDAIAQKREEFLKDV